MQLSDMRTVVRKRVGNPSTGDVPDIDVDRHINSAYVDIADNFRFHKVRKLCTFSTVAGTRRYGLPTDCGSVLKVRNATSTASQPRLEKLDARRAAELVNDSAITAEPMQYMRYRDWLELEPTPDDVYTIEVLYRADVTTLVADTDVPVLPSSWHEGIMRLAVWYYFNEEGDTPKANSAYNVYQLWASTKTNEVDEEKWDLDSGVSLPTLGPVDKGLDFSHSD